mmetsp:Transcript_19656/g.25904  ORF Transcript_19656/g.25904 Transcript_19656/m.25904 type:complete len:591 (+) Transcript_19656:163-1935(+)
MRPNTPLMKKNNRKLAASYTDFTVHYIQKNREANTSRWNRSYSAGCSDLNPIDRGRRQLYESLPFTSVFGMQGRERSFTRTFSNMSMTELHLAGEKELTVYEKTIDPGTVTLPLIMAVFISVISTFLGGYNTGVMNAPESVIFAGHSTLEWSLAVSVFAIGGPAGAMYGGDAANKHGRKGAIVIDAWFYLLAGILMCFAPNMYCLICGRAITGFAAGFTTVIVPIYLGELAPPTLRGTLGTLTQFSFCIGILFSYLLAFPLATENGWRVLIGVTPLLAILQLLCSPLLLETPRWLLSKDEHDTVARKNVAALRGFAEGSAEVEKEIGHMVCAMNVHKTRHSSAHSGGAIKDLVFSSRMRILVVSMLVLHTSQQLCGINAVFYYSTSFFQGVISNPLIGTTLAGAINVIGVYIAMKLMDGCNRRLLMIISGVGMLISCVFLTFALLGMTPNYVALFAVMTYVTFFEIGFGPIPWLIVAEMFDSKYVATAQSISCQVNWLANFTVGISFPYISASLGPWSFGPFAVCIALCIIYTYLYLPETANKSAEEIMGALNNPNRAENNDDKAAFAIAHTVTRTINENSEAKQEQLMI